MKSKIHGYAKHNLLSQKINIKVFTLCYLFFFMDENEMNIAVRKAARWRCYPAVGGFEPTKFMLITTSQSFYVDKSIHKDLQNENEKVKKQTSPCDFSPGTWCFQWNDIRIQSRFTITCFTQTPSNRACEFRGILVKSNFPSYGIKFPRWTKNATQPFSSYQREKCFWVKRVNH